MTRSTNAAARAYVALAATDTVLSSLGPRAHRLRHLTKPLLMPALAATLANADREEPALRQTLAAQALSGAGDVALLGTSPARFLTGVGAFFAAHLAYVSAFRSRGSAGLLSSPRSRAILAVGAGLACVNAVAAGRRDARLGVPVGVYGMVLGTMAASVAVLPDQPGRTRIQTGAALFLLSDSLIGVQLFLRDEPLPALEAAVMATYTGGQWLIADGIRTGH